VTEEISAGDRVAVDLAKGEVVNETRGRVLPGEALPPFLLDVLADGGLVPHLEKKLAAKRAGTLTPPAAR
jgi:3-isopropylmalate/(R)-2-methylmalate dehydratase small subunit